MLIIHFAELFDKYSNESAEISSKFIGTQWETSKNLILKMTLKQCFILGYKA